MIDESCMITCTIAIDIMTIELELKCTHAARARKRYLSFLASPAAAPAGAARGASVPPPAAAGCCCDRRCVRSSARLTLMRRLLDVKNA